MKKWQIAPGFPNGNDRFTKVLLQFDGNLNDDNLGGSSHTWSSVGVTNLAATGKFGSAALEVLPPTSASSRCVSTPAHADFDLGSLDFTVDCWVKVILSSAGGFFTGQSDATTGLAWFAQAAAGGPIGSPPTGDVTFIARVIDSTGAQTSLLGPAISGNPTGFNHFALVRSGNFLTLYGNGVAGTPVAFAGSVKVSSGSLSVGRAGDSTSANSLQAVYEAYRLSVGIARWNANFTPPTIPYSKLI